MSNATKKKRLRWRKEKKLPAGQLRFFDLFLGDEWVGCVENLGRGWHFYARGGRSTRRAGNAPFKDLASAKAACMKYIRGEREAGRMQ